MPHIHELYDFVVAFYIVHNGKVLLVNHPKYNKWMAPGGHIELNENPEEALYREALEETGLNVELITPKLTLESNEANFMPTPDYIDVHDANPPHKHISLTYFVRSHTDKFILSDEHTGMKWIGADELESSDYKLSDLIKFYSKAAISKAA